MTYTKTTIIINVNLKFKFDQSAERVLSPALLYNRYVLFNILDIIIIEYLFIVFTHKTLLIII